MKNLAIYIMIIFFLSAGFTAAEIVNENACFVIDTSNSVYNITANINATGTPEFSSACIANSGVDDYDITNVTISCNGKKISTPSAGEFENALRINFISSTEQVTLNNCAFTGWNLPTVFDGFNIGGTFNVTMSNITDDTSQQFLLFRSNGALFEDLKLYNATSEINTTCHNSYIANATGTDFYVVDSCQNITPPCIPSWAPQYSPGVCPSISQWFKTYTDANVCGVDTGLPGDNGTTVSCTFTPPVYANQTFDNKTTTDLGNVSNITAVQNFTVASSSSAVQWISPVNLENLTTLTDAIITTSAFVSVNKALIPSLNTPATVALTVPTTNGNTCADFTLFYASGYFGTQADIVGNGRIVATNANIGGDCLDPTVCTNVQCSAGILTFTAQHFDGFSLGNIPASTVQSCQNTRNTIYTGFAIIALLVLAGAAALIIFMMKGGGFDAGSIIASVVAFIAVGVILMIGYFIISNIPGILCGV